MECPCFRHQSTERLPVDFDIEAYFAKNEAFAAAFAAYRPFTDPDAPKGIVSYLGRQFRIYQRR